MKKALALLLCFLTALSLALTVYATDPFTVTVTPDKAGAEVGDTVIFTVSLSGTVSSTSASVEVFAGEGIEIISGEMLAANTTLSSYDLAKNKGVVAFSSARTLDGDFARITARLTEAEAADRAITVNVKLNPSGTEGTAQGRVNITSLVPTASVGSVSASKGETVELDVSLENMPKIKSLAASDVQYDAEALELVGAEWKLDGAVLASWDENTGKGVAAFRADTQINGVILTLSFRVKDGASEGEYPVSVKITGRTAGGETVEPATAPGTVTVGSDVLIGDVNGDGLITIRDLVDLKKLVAGASEDDYNMANSDINGDGLVTISDIAAIKKMLA